MPHNYSSSSSTRSSSSDKRSPSPKEQTYIPPTPSTKKKAKQVDEIHYPAKDPNRKDPFVRRKEHDGNYHH
ncbi:hypothetical protein MMC24_005209 [Lignoscripta atroalba]|nr:hypothetical protein [Lignoscripta atroalba]